MAETRHLYCNMFRNQHLRVKLFQHLNSETINMYVYQNVDIILMSPIAQLFLLEHVQQECTVY